MAFDQAAWDLQQANLHNAFRVDNTGAAVNAYGAGGQSTGGVNGSAIAPGFEGYNPSQPGGQLQQNGGSSQQNQYLSPQGQNAYMPQSSGQNSSSWGQSPWVNQTANALTAQSNQNLMQNVMPGIRSGAQSAGQYGGSRQAIAEGVAAGNAQTGLNSALASLYGNAYGQDQNAALQNKSLDNSYALGNKNADNSYALGNKNADNSYNLGLGNLSLTNQGQMQNFYTQQRGQDLQGVTAGANLYNSGNQGNLGIGQGQYTLGQTSMNAPANAISQYNSLISPYTGFGQSATNTNSGGGGVQGFAGGAMAGAQIANNLGLGQTSYTPQQIASANAWNVPTSAPAAPAFWPNA